uniref:Ig-like domain-containing protein n=1 Tax=Mola mola TaxID=94237 RepID=A0A3Q3VXU6_MOLML
EFPHWRCFARLSLKPPSVAFHKHMVREVKSVVGADCPLQCVAHFKPDVQYIAVRWYKVIVDPSTRLRGLSYQYLVNGTMQLPPQLLVGETHGILLRNVTCSDSGLYTCHLAAPVGEQNQEEQVLLTLSGCPESHAENMTDTAMAVIATAVLMLSLFVCLRNTLRDRLKIPTKEISLDAPLKPLDKKDLMSIYTMGPKPKVKHFCV